MAKMRLGWAVGAALFLGCATSASRQPPAPSAQSAQAEASDTLESQEAVAAAKPQPKRLICEEVATTGSHIKQRICRPAEVVEYEREDSQRNIRRMPNINTNPGN